MIQEETPPVDLLPWLTYLDFLTEKLRQETGDAQLHLLNQAWIDLEPDEQERLKLPSTSVLCREILMTSQTKPCWYARTLLPQITYQVDPCLFDGLKPNGSLSLGDLIFKGHRISRSHFRYAPIYPSSPEYQWVLPAWHQSSSVLWVRWSRFHLDLQYPFDLTEILLPNLIGLPQ